VGHDFAMNAMLQDVTGATLTDLLAQGNLILA
jgi:hypothetical protein